MKKKISIGVAVFLSSLYCYAGCVGPVVNGECLTGTRVYGYGSSNNVGYTSNSDSQYQYNLNDPRDNMRYYQDLDAQRRDQLNTNPKREQDRSSGQYGGGIHNNLLGR